MNCPELKYKLAPIKEYIGRENISVVLHLDDIKIEVQGGFFNWSGLKMTKSQPLKEFSELVLPKKQPRMKKV